MDLGQAARIQYRSARGRWVLLATVLGSSLAFIDSTVVNIALPVIGRDLASGAAGLQWIVNGYSLSLASLILLGGSLGDRFGRKRVFQLGVAWFATASLLCGLAPNVELLIGARVLQGIGGALLTPGALAILEASFASEDRARAIGAWSGLGGIGGALGPFLGGWLVEVANWRLIFLINVPLALLVLGVTARHVPESRNPAAARELDVAGVLTGAVGLGGLTYGFTAWPGHGPGSPTVLVPLAAGVLGMIGFVVCERRSRHPMLPLEIFRSRPFTGANLVTFLVYAANGGVFFLVVLNLQVVAGFSPLAGGLALLPVTALMLLLSARAGALNQRIGPRIPLTAGPLVCAVALAWMSMIGPAASYWTDVLPPVIVFGLGLSLLVAPLTATALGALDDAHAGIASGVNNAVARAAGLLAVAVLPLAAGLGAGSLTDPADLHHTYRAALLICAGLMVGGSLVALIFVPGRAPRQGTPVRSYCDVAGPPVHPGSENPSQGWGFPHPGLRRTSWFRPPRVHSVIGMIRSWFSMPAGVLAEQSDSSPGGLAGFATDLVERLGGPGAGLAVALENLFPPIPSEVILPLAGFAAGQGRMGFLAAIAWTTLGSLVGAVALYYVGVALGRDRVRAIAARLPLVKLSDVDRTEAWFARHGVKTVFFGRMIPIFRSLISIPAGVQRMPIGTFLLFTTLGSLIWNTVFISAGYLLAENWHAVQVQAERFQHVVIVACALAVGYFVVTRLRRVRREQQAGRGTIYGTPRRPEDD